ncbi:tRNA (adenosine(37)-N6)-threonylcarbamoyltransferase complex ATPase subunit type 1 TsaE [candidate division TA06 bacterium]|nr:tRNA (adenosine(37)-N6)-threonylcarbamoyltransferase complex ATPase subunit type 1 TsaE [candidate division TA06 bacterium]
MGETSLKGRLSNSEIETVTFAKKFAKNLKVGDIVAIYGNLGAGKTTFIKGLAAGLGYVGRVFSPTFIFVRPYKIGNQKNKIETLFHIDLYRSENKTDLRNVGIEEFLADKKAVSVVEWPEKIEESLPEKTIKIKIDIIGKSKRRIIIF